MIAKTQYDFTSLNDFLNDFLTPDEMLTDLSELVMNYALAIDEDRVGVFKRDVDNIYVIFQEIKKLRDQRITQ